MILGSSQDGHSSPPPCLSILGFLGYSDDPGIIPGWTQFNPLPCLSILGFLGYSDDPRIIPGWTQLTAPLSEYPVIPGILGRSWDHPGMDTAHHPPCLSILRFLGYSDYPGIIPGWTQLTTPLSEYPVIPGILGRSQDHPGMDTGHPPSPPLSEYPGIPGILGRSRDHSGIDTANN